MMKLQYQNNWQFDEYFVDGRRIDSLEKVRIGKQDYPVVAKSVRVTYEDMGAEYISTSTHFFVQKKVFGILMDFDLNLIVPKVEVSALQYAHSPEK